MAKAVHLSAAKNINPIQIPTYQTATSRATVSYPKLNASRKVNQEPLINKRASKSPRRMITIPASSGKWPGKWTCEYLLSLRDLQLDDLAEDGRKDTEVYISLALQKHTGFGLSVDGKVMVSIARKCSSCSSPYCRKIDTSICVWVLPEGRVDPSTEMPEIGSDDPSVIYVRPGDEADLDSLIKDTIRLQTAVKETCSESCEKSEPKLHCKQFRQTSISMRGINLYKNLHPTVSSICADIGAQRKASLETRWSRLLQLRNATQRRK